MFDKRIIHFARKTLKYLIGSIFCIRYFTNCWYDKIMFKNIPFNRVEWVTSGFLMTTALLTLTAVPWYFWTYGWDWFLFAVFLYFYISTGMSIAVGYHRLFSHKAFQAKWPVKLYVLLFGAAAFENSALWWSSEHRKHHKHVDTDDDPYDITKGFFWAHMGWLMFKLKPASPLDNVEDLKKDKLVYFQHKLVHPLSFLMSFGLPTLIGYLYAIYTGNLSPTAGALGGLLIPGVARVVMGVTDVFGPSDVYGIKRLTDEDTILMRGAVTATLAPDSSFVDSKNDPMQPLAWLHPYKAPNGKTGTPFCSPMGASVDLVSEDLRRLIVNAAFFLTGQVVPDHADVSYVDPFYPSFYGFIRDKEHWPSLDMQPQDYGLGKSPTAPEPKGSPKWDYRDFPKE